MTIFKGGQAGLLSHALPQKERIAMPDCANSSPPLILRKFQGFGGIWANSGEIREISGNFGKTQGNSVEFSGVLYGA